MGHHKFPIWSDLGRVPKDKTICFLPSFVEEERITIVEEWVKSHFSSVLSVVGGHVHEDVTYITGMLTVVP